MRSDNTYRGWIMVLAVAIILILTFTVFFPSLDNGFVNWDDPAYIHKNSAIQSLAWPNIYKIFTSFVNSNYQPLTILSFAVEYHFSGLEPKVYHWTNCILHLLNTLLVYCFVALLTKRPLTAIMCSLLFGIHPMRVESVAWITERKDVLFSFFYLGSLISYIFYRVKNLPRPRYLILCFMLFILSLFSKPAAVSLPIILLLIDYYQKRRWTTAVILEKLPFLLLSFLFSLLAIYGTFTPLTDHYPVIKSFSLGIPVFDFFRETRFHILERFLIVSYALLIYVTKLIWVVGLSCYYPPPVKVDNILPLIYYLSPIIILLTGGIAIYRFRSKRTIIFGFVFFISTIAVNLPFSDVGHVAIVADRFTYIPYIGLFIIIGELIGGYINKDRQRLLIASFLMIFVVFFLSSQAWQRCKVWKNSGTLWSDVIHKYPGASLAYHNRGNYFLNTQQINLAIEDYNSAISLNPQYAQAYNNRGRAYFLKSQYDQEFANFLNAVKLDPTFRKIYITFYLNRINIDLRENNIDQLMANCNRILTLSPNHPKALSIQAQYHQK